MNECRTQQIWDQLHELLFCGNCKAGKILIWEHAKESDQPRDSDTFENAWIGVHCDYFKRPVPSPLRLRRCGAYQTKEK
jgi:aerobic-type carbon monoxide dehydrogenase small subunit (CoxS/CutS family)